MRPSQADNDGIKTDARRGSRLRRAAHSQLEMTDPTAANLRVLRGKKSVSPVLLSGFRPTPDRITGYKWEKKSGCEISNKSLRDLSYLMPS